MASIWIQTVIEPINDMDTKIRTISEYKADNLMTTNVTNHIKDQIWNIVSRQTSVRINNCSNGNEDTVD